MYIALVIRSSPNVLGLYNIFHAHTEQPPLAGQPQMRVECGTRRNRRNVNKRQVSIIPLGAGLFKPVVELTSSSRRGQGEISKLAPYYIQHRHGRLRNVGLHYIYIYIYLSVLFQRCLSSFVIRRSWSVASCKFSGSPFSLFWLLSTWWRHVAFVCVKRSSIWQSRPSRRERVEASGCCRVAGLDAECIDPRLSPLHTLTAFRLFVILLMSCSPAALFPSLYTIARTHTHTHTILQHINVGLLLYSSIV